MSHITGAKCDSSSEEVACCQAVLILQHSEIPSPVKEYNSPTQPPLTKVCS